MPTVKPTLPKGTRDFLPENMWRRQYVINTIKNIFERYGYEPLETPAIEKLEVLSGKYGEEGESLIFKVLKRGTPLEELLRDRKELVVQDYHELVNEALRYDLTVPLSRVVAMYQHELIFPFKRYQIQPVWRADRPQRGRYREFYQCDVDTIGTESMLADAEAIAIVYEVLNSLKFKKFKIRINNRKILNGIVNYAGILAEKGHLVFIAIDKLEKIGLEGVQKELAERGINSKQADKIFQVLEISQTSKKVLEELAGGFAEVEEIRQGTEELLQIVQHLKNLDVPDTYYKIDLYLARGLGYYTGPIHESVVEEPKIGSLTGGGRYDNLIGMFSGREIPATGVAFGIERIIDVLSQQDMLPESKTKSEVLVTLFDESTVEASLKFTQQLRKAGVHAEHFFDLSKLKKQFTFADKKKIPFVVIIGPDEMQKQQVTIKELSTGEQKVLQWEEAVKFILQAHSE
ncbi:MAG: histidine--tRNA ligase [bacterium]